MRKSNQQSLGQLLDIFIRQNQLSAGLTQAELQQCWQQVAGEFVAKHTTGIRIVKNILHITMDNAACREELMYRKSELLTEVNKLSRDIKITDIIVR